MLTYHFISGYIEQTTRGHCCYIEIVLKKLYVILNRQNLVRTINFLVTPYLLTLYIWLNHISIMTYHFCYTIIVAIITDLHLFPRNFVDFILAVFFAINVLTFSPKLLYGL